jgi:hypothetical protein
VYDDATQRIRSEGPAETALQDLLAPAEDAIQAGAERVVNENRELRRRATPTGGRERVRFEPRADGSVQQLWQSTTAGKSWKVEFDGEYRKSTKIPM